MEYEEEIIFSLSKVGYCPGQVGCPCRFHYECGEGQCCGSEEWGTGGHDNTGNYDKIPGCVPYKGEPALPSLDPCPVITSPFPPYGIITCGGHDAEGVPNPNAPGYEVCCPSGCCAEGLDPITSLPWICCPDNLYCAQHVCDCPSSGGLDQCKSNLIAGGLTCQTIGTPCAEGEVCKKVNDMPPSPGECQCVSSYLSSRLVLDFSWKGNSPP